MQHNVENISKHKRKVAVIVLASSLRIQSGLNCRLYSLSLCYCCGHWFLVSPFFTFITTGAFFCPLTKTVDVFLFSE